jgi:hypothetical protein
MTATRFWIIYLLVSTVALFGILATCDFLQGTIKGVALGIILWGVWTGGYLCGGYEK